MPGQSGQRTCRTEQRNAPSWGYVVPQDTRKGVRRSDPWPPVPTFVASSESVPRGRPGGSVRGSPGQKSGAFVLMRASQPAIQLVRALVTAAGPCAELRGGQPL